METNKMMMRKMMMNKIMVIKLIQNINQVVRHQVAWQQVMIAMMFLPRLTSKAFLPSPSGVT